MEVKLRVIVGSNAGQELAIPGPKFFIGRAEDCQLRPRSDLISRHHCALIVEEQLLAVRDFGSKNGTYVNGERVAAERELKNGDVLKVGPLEFEVCVTISVAAKKRPKVNSVQEAAARTATTEFDLNVDVGGWLNPDDRALGEADTSVNKPADTEEVVLGTKTTVLHPNKPPAKGPYVPPGPYVAPGAGQVADAETGSSDSTVSESGLHEKVASSKAAADKKAPGKLPLPPAAKDSFSAAADMLRKLRKR